MNVKSPKTTKNKKRQGTGRKPTGTRKWRGEDVADKVLLLHQRGGYGDTIQMARYIPIAAQLCERLIVLVPRSLFVVLQNSFPDVEVTSSTTVPRFDYYRSILTLPALFDDIPNRPYLRAQPASIQLPPGLNIGLVWAGRGEFRQDKRRSMKLRQFKRISLTGLNFISLQKGRAARQVPPSGMSFYDFTGKLTTFADTASLIMRLDLVIAVDTAVAHLAGALGKRVWLLNRFHSSWRWGPKGQNTVWYPSMTVVRQPKPGDWNSVLENVRARLEAMLVAKGVRSVFASAS